MTKILALLALKNLDRYKKRTLITASTIAFGIMALIITDGLLTGISQQSDNNLIQFETGSAQIRTQKSWDEKDYLLIRNAIEDPEPIQQELKAWGIQATGRTDFLGEMILREGGIQTRFTALNPETDGQVFDLERYVVEGEWLTQNPFGIVMGAWLAQDLDLKTGDFITIRTRAKNGNLQTLDLKITGLLNSPHGSINRGQVFLSSHLADEQLLMRGSVTSFVIRYPMGKDLDLKLHEKINSLIQSQIQKDLVFLDWRILGQEALEIAAAKSKGTSALLFMIILIAAVGIINTMLMAVYERIRELGTLQALGLSPGHILSLIIFEAGGIGLLGSFAGALMGTAVNIYFIFQGLDFSFISRNMDIGYRISGQIFSSWNWGTVVGAILLSTFLAMGSALIPARKALSLEITACLRHN